MSYLSDLAFGEKLNGYKTSLVEVYSKKIRAISTVWIQMCTLYGRSSERITFLIMYRLMHGFQWVRVT